MRDVPTSITDQMNIQLIAEVSEEDIKHTLFMVHPKKVPGSGGMTGLFYKHAWHLIKNDVVELVNSFMRTGKLDKQLNMTNMCMISKTERPTMMTDLRPIGLCNVGYKIISKVLCQRLKVCLPKLVSEFCGQPNVICGQPNCHIVSQGGLHQGDPLSPYLFILCTKVLIFNI